MGWSTASGRHEIEARLRRVGGQRDEEIDLAETALFLAALDRPRVPLQRYRHHLSLLEREVAELGAQQGAEESLPARVEALNEILFERYGYEGDELNYDDLQNANLMRVIDRRKGLPITLGILYLQAARAQGWPALGLNFPGHFLVCLERGAERLVVDPFHRGRVRDTAALRELLKSVAGPDAELAPEHYAPAGNREILKRLQNNIKVRLLRGDDTKTALEVVESMIMFAPDHATLWREAGLLNNRLGNLRAAIMSLEHFLELGQEDQARHEAATLLQRLRIRLH